MFVVTLDQRASRRSSDLVDGLLRILSARGRSYLRGFERTAGDEIQGVLDDPVDTVALTLEVVRDGHWSVGIGVGAVREPLPASTRAGHGPAFTAAREAVTRAKTRPTGLAVRGEPAAPVMRAQTALDLLAAVVARRTARGWEAVDLAATGRTQAEVGALLGISKQAVSQRLQAAEWHLEGPGRELAAHCLSEADGIVTST